MSNLPFYSLEDFPELIPLQKQWKELRDEALEHINSFYKVGENIPDERNKNGQWRMMPLQPASDDIALDIKQGGNIIEVMDKWKNEFPITRKICKSIDNGNEYCLSLLGPGGHIGAHSHGRNRVSCILGLQVPNNCFIRVGNKFKEYEDGKFVIFDFREKHECWNQSDKDRLVLLVSLPNRYNNEVGFLKYLK